MKKQLRTITFSTLLLMTLIAAPSFAHAGGTTQIGGSSVYAAPDECVDPAGAGAVYALKLSGDLVGCHYVFAQTSHCAPSGAYQESGYEIFVGQYNGDYASFRTTYKFEGKYDNCLTLAREIFGRCQHPIVAGSGQGAFAGASGRLDFKDDVETLTFYYRGHVRF